MTISAQTNLLSVAHTQGILLFSSRPQSRNGSHAEQWSCSAQNVPNVRPRVSTKKGLQTRISGKIQGRNVLVELARLHKDDQGPIVAIYIVIEGIAHNPTPCFQAVRRCEEALHDAGLETPTWRDVRVSTRARVAARTERAQVWLASRCQQDFRRAIPRNTKHADGVTTIPRLVVLSPSSLHPSRNCPLKEDRF